jgi:dTDP-4-dehydrorhamnose 3,5-epimerase
MKVTRSAIPDVLVLEPRVFRDARGHFFESWNADALSAAVGKPISFVQDNQSYSKRGVLRGLHYQTEPFAQGKLVQVVQGKVWDVAVDLRPNSSTLGQWTGHELSAGNRQQLWIPEGFAHGFLVLSATAVVQYKVTEPYSMEHERAVKWDDPDLAIRWPRLVSPYIISGKDQSAAPYRTAARLAG